MRNYRDLLVSGKAHKLTLAVYKITLLFPKEERIWTDQPDSACVCLHCGQFGGRLRQAVRRRDGAVRADRGGRVVLPFSLSQRFGIRAECAVCIP